MTENSISSPDQTLNSNSTNPAIVTSPSQQPMQSMHQQQGSVMQRSPSMSRFNHVQGQGQFGGGGMFGQGSFGGGVMMTQQQQLQLSQQLQQQQQQRAGLMGQNGQLNMQSQMLVSPRQKAGLVQRAQYYAGNMSGQMLQGIQSGGVTGPHNMPQQMKDNGALNYTQQHINQGQLRQQMLQQNPLNSQAQGLTRTSSLAFMNPQMPGLAQNGQPIMQNSLTQQQQQFIKQMPGMNTPASPAYPLQQQRQHQLLLQQQMASTAQNSLAMNSRQLNQLVQNQPTTPQQQHYQQQLAQQGVANQQQQSPRMVGPTGQKTFSLTGSQPNVSGATTPGGSSSQGTEVTNQFLGKRKIRDLVSQVDPHANLDPEVEDMLLELGDSFIESATSFAITFAKHRNSSTLEAKDLLLHLEKNWNLKIPGYSCEGQKNPSRPASSDIHNKRLDMIRTLMESSQSRGNTNNSSKEAAAATKPIMHGVGGHGQHNSNHQNQKRPSLSSEQLLAQSVPGSQLLHQHH